MDAGAVISIGLATVVWLAWAGLSWWIVRARPRGDDEIGASAMMRLIQVYARVVHRLETVGLDWIEGRGPDRPSPSGRGVLIVANHTAGVDPMLIQAALPFEVRWMMADDMRIPSLESLWEFGRIIFVGRQAEAGERGDSRGIRDALRHLKAGGVLGMFPEGNIERPPEQILPFRAGVGMLIARSGAEVVPVIIEGTPRVEPAWASLWTRSRSRIRFLAPRVFDRSRRIREASGNGNDVLGDQLRQLFLDETGWPANPNPPRFRDGKWWYADGEGSWIPASEFVERMKGARSTG